MKTTESLKWKWEQIARPASKNGAFRMIHFIWSTIFIFVAIPTWVLEFLINSVINIVGTCGQAITTLLGLQIIWLIPGLLLGALKIAFFYIFFGLHLLCSLPNTIYLIVQDKKSKETAYERIP